ncbi:hypothetical protein Vretifemale_20912 [Volvox reticuliferus]|uniref:Uncharacterized protein n=1 Tax=Volvox reticuliferus TaxID=1737510 RepID=A0A8J4D0T3_9CHLO|nr:hypothetical protein Vretifemale_20912 [Volvox reticuliferus]
MPWPVQATVEGLMATEATHSIDTFLSFCVQYYSTWRAEQLQQPELPAAPSISAAAGGEQFYDAVEDESELRAGGEAEEGETSVVPYQPPRLEDIIVDCLRQIQASSAETARSLRNLEELIRNMDDNMQVRQCFLCLFLALHTHTHIRRFSSLPSFANHVYACTI